MQHDAIVDGTTANPFWNTAPSSFCVQSKCSSAVKVVLEALHLVNLRDWKSCHEQGRGQLCNLWSRICSEKLFLSLPPSSLHGVHKKKTLQVAAEYFSPHFLDFQLADSCITEVLSVNCCKCSCLLKKLYCRKGDYLLKNSIRSISAVPAKLVFSVSVNDSRTSCLTVKEGLIVPPFL